MGTMQYEKNIGTTEEGEPIIRVIEITVPDRITKEQFQAYENVRESGATNMWDTSTVSELSDGVLTKKDALEIIKQYNSLCETYPDVRS